MRLVQKGYSAVCVSELPGQQKAVHFLQQVLRDEPTWQPVVLDNGRSPVTSVLFWFCVFHILTRLPRWVFYKVGLGDDDPLYLTRQLPSGLFCLLVHAVHPALHRPSSSTIWLLYFLFLDSR